MTLFVVETLSQFKHKYLIEAETADEAQALWQLQNDDPDFHEASQQFLGEIDTGIRVVQEITDEVDEYLKDRAEDMVNR